MSARDDFPNHGHYAVHEQMLTEIDRLREENTQLKIELQEHEARWDEHSCMEEMDGLG